MVNRPLSTQQKDPPTHHRRSQSVSKMVPSGRPVSFQSDVQAQLREQSKGKLPYRNEAPTTSSRQSHIPFPVSTGDRRQIIYNENHNDPESVARAILELREKREQQAVSASRKQQHRSQSTTARYSRETHDAHQQQMQQQIQVQHNHSNNNALQNMRSSSNLRVPDDGVGSSRSTRTIPVHVRIDSVSSHSKSANHIPQPEQRHSSSATKVVAQYSNRGARTSHPSNELNVGQQGQGPGSHDVFSKQIHHTEKKIDGLMQELDDLKFFEEIDQAGGHSSTIRSQSLPRPRPQSPPRQQASFGHSSKVQRGDSIPIIIQATAPGRFPLPPPPVIASPALNDAAPLPSPRQISKLDRVALELETQTLCRKVEVLRREKQTLMSQIDMYEVVRRDEDRNIEKVHQLEGALQDVRAALKQAKADLIAVRERTVAEYEHRLQENASKLQATLVEVDKLRTDRDQAHQHVVKCKIDMEHQRTSLHSEYKAQEKVFENQLQEITDLAEELQKEVQEKEKELLELQRKHDQDLAFKDSESRQISRDLRKQLATRDGQIQKLMDTMTDKENMMNEQNKASELEYKRQIASLGEQLSSEQSKLDKEATENVVLQQKIQEQNGQISRLKQASHDQSKLVTEMTSRLDAVHSEYREKFKELREAFETKEKRRLSEIVQAQQNEFAEYELRIQALREQLTLATDRHHAEIEQKDNELRSKLSTQRDTLRREIEIEYRQQLHVVEERLASTKQEYEFAEQDRQRLRLIADSAPQQAESLREELQKELNHQEGIRLKEISRLQGKVSDLTDDTLMKDGQIKELFSKISECQSLIATRTRELESTHAKQIQILNDQCADEKQAIQREIVQAKDELSKCEYAFTELQVSLESRIDELTIKLEQSQRSKEQSDAENLSRIEQLQSSYEKTKDDLLKEKMHGGNFNEIKGVYEQTKSELLQEKKRNEKVESDTRVQIAVLEGNIRASAASTQKKIDMINELEDKIRQQNLDFESTSREFENKVSKLDDDLSLTKQAISNDHASFELKEKELLLLKDENKSLQNEQARLHVEISVLEGKIRNSSSLIREKSVEFDQSRIALQNELESLQDELKRTKEDLESLRSSFELNEKESLLLKDENKSLQNVSNRADEIQATLRDTLENNQELGRDCIDLTTKLNEVQTSLATERERNENEEARLHVEISVLEGKIRNSSSDIREKSEEYDQGLAALQNELESLQDELKQTKKELESERSGSDLKRSKVMKLKQEYERLIREKSNEIDQLDKSISEILKQNDAVNSRCTNLDNLYQEATKSLSLEQVKNQDLQLEVDATKKSLSFKLSEKEKVLKLTKDDLSCAQEQVGELQALLRKSNDSIDLGTSELSVKQAQIESFERLLHIQSQRINELEEALSDATHKTLAIASLEKKLETSPSTEVYALELKNLRSELKHANDQLQEEKFTLRRRTEVLENDRKKQEQNLRQKSTLIDELESNLAKAMKQEKNANDRVLELETELREVNDEIEALRNGKYAPIKEWREKASKLEGRLLASETLLSVKQDSIQHLEQRLQDAINNSSASTKDLQREVEVTRQKLSSSSDELIKTKCELETIRKLVDSQQGQHLEETDAMNNKIKSLERKLVQARKKEKSLSECIELLDSTYQTAQNQLLNDREYLASTESSLREEVSILEKKLRLTESKMKDAKAEVNRLETQLERSKADSNSSVNSLEEQLSSLQLQLERKNKDLCNCEETLSQKIEELQDKSYLVSSLEAQLESVSDNCENSEVHLRVQISMLDGKVRSLDSTLKEKRGTIENLETELARVLDASASLQQDAVGYKESLACVQDQLETERSKMQDREQEFGIELSLLKAQLIEKTDLLHELETKLFNSQSGEKSAVSQIMELEENQKKSVTRIEELTRKLSTANELLEKERTQLDECLDQLDNVKDTLKKTKQKADEAFDNEAQCSALEIRLADLENDKNACCLQLQALREDHDNALKKLEEYERVAETQNNQHGVLQRTIDDLRSAQASERREKESLSEQILGLQADLSFKNQNLMRIPKLQSQLKQMVEGREELQAQIGRVEADLARKEKQISQASEQYTALVQELETNLLDYKKENERLLDNLRSVEAELARKVERLSRQTQELELELENQRKTSDDLRMKLRMAEGEISSKILQLDSLSDEISNENQSKVESLTRNRAMLESKIQELQEDCEDREKQIKESSEKFSTKILELQMKVEELTLAKSLMQSRLSRTEADLDEKDDKLNASTNKYTSELAELNEQLSRLKLERDDFLQKISLLDSKVEESKKNLAARSAEVEAGGKENRSLMSKIRANDSELQRKEKQINDIVDRYTNEIATLENQLDSETREKASLQKRLKQMQNPETGGFPDYGRDTDDLSEQIAALEKTVDDERANVREAHANNLALVTKVDEQMKANDLLQNSLQDLTMQNARSVDLLPDSQSLQDRLTSLQQAIEESNQRLRDSDASRREEEDKVAAQQETIAALKKEIDYLREKNSSNVGNSSTSWEMRAKIGSLEKSVEVERALAHESDLARQHLERAVLDLQRSKDALESEIKAMKSSVSNVTPQTQILTEKVQSLEKSIDSERSRLIDAIKKRNELEEKLHENGKRLHDKENIIYALELEVKSLHVDDSKTLKTKVTELENALKAEHSIALKNDFIRKELEAKLKEESVSKVSLLKEVESLKQSSTMISTAAIEAQALRKQLSIMEEAAENERWSENGQESTAKELELKLIETEKSKANVEKRLERVNAERNEVINALEEVINEVQNREDEIEALATILRKRDEELEHAKLIATKALASAQEIKARYKGRERDEKTQELQSVIDTLSQKNDDLQSKQTKLKRELDDRRKECATLKTALQKPTSEITSSGDTIEHTEEEFRFVKDTLSPFQNNIGRSSTDSFDLGSVSIELNDTLSTQSAELNAASGWLHDFDSREPDEPASSSAQTEPSSSSRRSIERDALRKYVRKRYLKSKTAL